MNSTLSHYKARHETMLHQSLEYTQIPASRIKAAMQYALFPGGKRLRPLLVYLSGEMFQLPIACLDTLAVAIELAHSYSLIHDDLPCMDNDDFRRNKPSCHRAFDEATAILAGDGLQALSIEILLTQLTPYLSSKQIIAITLELTSAMGPSGMISGQSLDLSELGKSEIEDAKLRAIHSLKTGKLILACINTVLKAHNSLAANLQEALQSYAKNLGLVFQMQDDFLDAYKSTDSGKKRASDHANHKLTFANLYSQMALREQIQHTYQLAIDALACFGPKAQNLLALTQYLQDRSEL